MSENVDIIGAEMTTFGRYPDRSALRLGAEAALAALDDAGLANSYDVALHLRGEAGERQVRDARVGLMHVVGIGSASGMHILERVSS